MAALVLQSRFAGLKIEDDDCSPSRQSQKGKKNSNKTNTAKKSEPLKKSKTTNNIKPQNCNGNKKKNKGRPTPTTEQWEQWKQKDEEFVDGNFECEMQEAILLSKLDYEEKKDVYKLCKREALLKKTEEQSRAPSKKQKKKNVMSLEQFNDMIANHDENKYDHTEENVSEEHTNSDTETEFFERVEEEAKIELVKDRDKQYQRQPASDEVINRLQFQIALERKDSEIEILKQHVTKLKEELLGVRSRNKQLCTILGQAEMKRKAEVLEEVERLRVVQTELTAEVSNLNIELERERSRNTTDCRAKDKKRKGGSAEKEK